LLISLFYCIIIIENGKIMRRILKRLFTGEELGDLSTLSTPESVEKIKKIINK